MSSTGGSVEKAENTDLEIEGGQNSLFKQSVCAISI